VILKPALVEDLPEIAYWIECDPHHKDQPAEFWLTGNDCYFAAKHADAEGTVAYTRVDTEGDGFRLHTQFAPPDVVAKGRVAAGIVEFLQMLVGQAKQTGRSYIVTESTSPKLVAFLTNLGWHPTTGLNNDLQFDIPKE
jgi:hypothetical protein